ncbi:hypothetical protein O9992_20900 [Vibrio lentus]|nr:hypothetical protein [Vibrio lentus]
MYILKAMRNDGMKTERKRFLEKAKAPLLFRHFRRSLVSKIGKNKSKPFYKPFIAFGLERYESESFTLYCQVC